MKVYKQHSPETTAFLLTGGRPKSYGSCGAYSEAAVMQRWLENAGISHGIWREGHSNNTLDNAELSWRRLENLRQRELLAANATLHVITQSWHMVKAKECFNVFFSGGHMPVHYDSVADIVDDTMAPFEQDSYAQMYRIQLQNWLPWQLGFNRRLRTSVNDHKNLIDSYVRSRVQEGVKNVFFQDGLLVAGDENLISAPPSSAWSRINDMQWRMFLQTLSEETATDAFVVSNDFSQWGSFHAGHLPRYVTAFNPRRDSGDLVGLSCPGQCGRRYDALRITAFLHRPSSRQAQRGVLEVAQAWAATAEPYSLQTVAMFVLRQNNTMSGASVAEVSARMKDYNESAFSKQLGTARLQTLASE